MAEKIKIIEKNKESLIIGFAGDVMLGRLVNEQISIVNNYTYPWGNMLPMLKSTDLNIINLETTLTNSEKIVPKVFNFKATPDKIKTLTAAKIDVVNLANNHILDFSEEGLLETIETLDKEGIKHMGAGKNKTEASKPLIIKKKGIKIGILGYTDNEEEWEAQENKPGTNYAEINDYGFKKIESEIKNLKEKADFVVLSMHWGPNMNQKPSKQFQEFAHKAVDAGVDIFHGHSSHIFQGIEIYKDKVIFYDTGDFVDDYAVDPLLRNDQSFFYLVEVDKNGIKRIELIPTLIYYMQVNKAGGDDYKAIVGKVRDLSKEFNIRINETEEGVFVELNN